MSTTDLVVSSKKKAKKSQMPITLDELFNTVSNIRSSSLYVGDISNVVLTPRSDKACTNMGINPEVLKIRELESFWEANIDPEIIRIRHSAYVERRHDLMKKCVQERKRVLNEESQLSLSLAKTALTDDEMSKEMTASQIILEREKQKNSEIIRLELKKIRKIKEKQEKEIQQMIAFEMRNAEIQKEMQERIEEEKRKEMLEKKGHEKRFKEKLEERRLQDAHRAVMDQLQEEENKRYAQEMHERDCKIQEERERKILEQKRQIRKECERKFQEHEEAKKKLQNFFMEEQIRLRNKLEEMNLSEQRKQEVLAERHRLKLENNRRKQELLKVRIDKNRQVAKFIENKRKEDMQQKQENYEYKRAMTVAEQEEERRLQAEIAEMKEMRRQQILFEKQQSMEKESEQLLHKLEEEEFLAEQAKIQKFRETQIQMEKRNVRNQLKEDNKNRIMRLKELHRKEVIKKIEHNDNRIHSIVEERQHLIMKRREQAAEARRQKEEILKVMDVVRSKTLKSAPTGQLLTNNSSISSSVNKSVSGGYSLPAITQPNGTRGVSAPLDQARYM